MSTPVPAPRLSKKSDKKPVPTPRRLIPIRTEGESAEEPPEELPDPKTLSESPKEMEINSNTFTRRVKTISSASKQIAGDIGDRVQEGKKAVIEGTRQSVRRLTRRFHSQTHDLYEDDAKKGARNRKEIVSEAELDLFSSIKFNSPINNNNNNGAQIYVNVEKEDSSEENLDRPPPTYPPPPLRDEVSSSIYDEPQSLASGSTNSSENAPSFPDRSGVYESVFPVHPTRPEAGSETGSSSDNAKSSDLSRSGSWNFYDSIPKSENLYNNVDSTPTLSATRDDLSDSCPASIIRTNSIYTNHEISRTERIRASQSVLMQFDPLTPTSPPVDEDSRLSDLKALEELLQGDLYNHIPDDNTYDNWSISNESELMDEYANPPTPPARYDSLPDEPSPVLAPKKPQRKSVTNNKTQEVSKSQFYTDIPTAKTTTTTTSSSSSSSPPRPRSPKFEESKPLKWLKRTQEVLRKAPDIVRGVRGKDNYLLRPSLAPRNNLPQKGMLYKITTVENLFGEYGARWCVLEGKNLVCYYDNSCENAKETFPMGNILSVQIIVEQKYKYKYENQDLYCFEINAPPGGTRGGHIYGSKSASERRVWMQRIAENLTSAFSPMLTSDYNRMGWAYVREGVNGEWIGAWILLHHRTFYYATDVYGAKNIDLRKARTIGIQTPQESEFTPRTQDKGPNMLLDYAFGSLYLRMWTCRETKVWSHVVKIAAHYNGANLDEQQLTKNDIPVIVERCINFIYVHGSMSEGIYRKAGAATVVNEILTAFRKDAWLVQLTRDKYSEHDVSTSLKRFFRDVPEPLLTISKRQYLYQVSKVKSKDERIRMYRAAFDQFPKVNSNTVRKLLGHLHFITSLSVKNKMNIENLAAVWGPTLMHYEDNVPQQDSIVVGQLIDLYPYIFPENAKEAEQEKLMLQVLEKHFQSPQGSVNNKTSGDFRVWVYLNNKQGPTFNVAIGPKKTAYDICSELSGKIKQPAHELQLEEYVLNSNLVRPIHHKEKVLDVVLKWGYWEEADRKENCLILCQLSKYWEYIQDKPLPVSGELKFADSKSKTLKPYTFEFAQSKLNYYKNKACTQILGSWNIEDITWYFGYESKRNPPTKWAITFIPKSNTPHRSKQSPFFGNIVVWNDPSVRANWLAAMLKAEHPNDLKPPPQIVNLMNC